MTIEEYHSQVRKAMEEIKRTRAEETFRIASDVLGLVKSRVINTGKRSDGSQFSPYSGAYVPYWYHGSSYLKSGRQTDFDIRKKQKELLAAHGYFTTYVQWRQINNRKTFKNFSFTNRMWHRIRAIVILNSETATNYDLRADNQEDQNILLAHNKREQTDLTELNTRERRIVAGAHERRIARILAKYGVN